MKSVYEIENIEDLLIDLNDKNLFVEPFRLTANEIATQSMNETVRQARKKFRIFTKKVSANQTAVSSKKSNFSFFRNGYSIKKALKADDTITIEAHGYPMKLRHYDTSRGDIAYTSKYKKNRKKSKAKDIKVNVIRKVTKLVGKAGGVAYFRTHSGELGTISFRDGKQVKEKNIITLPSMFEQIDIRQVFSDMWDEKANLRFIHHLSRKRGKFF